MPALQQSGYQYRGSSPVHVPDDALEPQEARLLRKAGLPREVDYKHLKRESSPCGEVPMKKLFCVLASFMTAGLCAFVSPGQAALIPACQVDNPPANCETMLAVIAHVRLPKQPVTTVVGRPGCGSKFDGI